MYQLIGMDEYNSSNSDEVVKRGLPMVQFMSSLVGLYSHEVLLVLLEEGHEASTAGVIE